MEEDWYAFLGLQQGIKASCEAIRRAFHRKALLCHPDKRPDDPLASAKFQSIQKAYDVLSDPQARKAYDALLERKREVDAKRNSISEKLDPKKRKLMEDLNTKERLCKAQRQEEEDRETAVKHILHTEILQMRDKEKIVKVSWQGSRTYSAVRLKEIFGQFGLVEDIRMDPTQCSALVVMSCRDEVVRVATSMVNPSLVVIPLVTRARFSPSRTFTHKSLGDYHATETSHGEINGAAISNSAAFHSYEEAVLAKLRRKKQNHSNVQVLGFRTEESQKDGVCTNSSTTGEKIEETFGKDSTTPLKGGSANIVIEPPAPHHSNGQFDERKSRSADDDDTHDRKNAF